MGTTKGQDGIVRAIIVVPMFQDLEETRLMLVL